MERIKHVTTICVCRELSKGEGARYAEGAQCEHFHVPLWSKGRALRQLEAEGVSGRLLFDRGEGLLLSEAPPAPPAE